MQYKFNKHLQNLLPDRPLRILVAVSGGADSMCLLDLLCGSGMELDISIAHMNFSLRGEESDADEALVRSWAETNGVRFFSKRVDTVKYADENFISIEMAARDLRYNWFYSLKSEYGFDYIALAHHANDNAETLLLNMLRGSGLKGICGMKALDGERALLRPLLVFTRSEIERHVAQKGIPFRTDRTNADIKFHRNRIRNVIVPEFEKINPNAVAVLNRDMGHFSAAAEIVSSLVRKKKEELVVMAHDGNWPFLNVVKNKNARKFIALKSAGRVVCAVDVERLLEEEHHAFWLYEILSEYGFSSARIEDLSESLCDSATKRIECGDHTAVKERGYIKVYRGEVKKEECSAVIANLDKPVSVKVGNSEIVLSIADNNGNGDFFQSNVPDCGKITLYLSADKLEYPLVLRSINAGDKWRPFGMRGIKKVSDYLTDIKMDSALKGEVLALCNNPGDIVCLPGLEISDSCRVCAETKKVLRIELVR